MLQLGFTCVFWLTLRYFSYYCRVNRKSTQPADIDLQVIENGQQTSGQYTRHLSVCLSVCLVWLILLLIFVASINASDCLDVSEVTYNVSSGMLNLTHSLCLSVSVSIQTMLQFVAEYQDSLDVQDCLSVLLSTYVLNCLFCCFLCWTRKSCSILLSVCLSVHLFFLSICQLRYSRAYQRILTIFRPRWMTQGGTD